LISSGVELLKLNQTLTLGDFALVEFYLGQTGFSKLDLNLIGAASTVRFRIVLEDGYVPSAGSAFDILDWVGVVPSTVTNFASLLELPSATSWVTTDFNTEGILRVLGTPEPASLLSQPLDVTVDPGQVAIFTVALAGAEPLLCQWSKNGVDILGATGRTYIIPAAVEDDEGQYRVRVTNGLNTVESDAATLVVNDGPLIVTQPLGGDYLPGSAVTLVVIAEGATEFEWRRGVIPVVTGVVNDVVAQGARSTLTLAPISEGDEGVYTVLVSNSAGSIVSAEAVVTVQDPVAITSQPVGRVVNEGSLVTFAVEATGQPTLSYQWRRGALPVGGNSPTLQVTAGPSTWGEYTVTVSNAFSSELSSVALLEDAGSTVVIVVQPEPKIAAVGATVSLTCQATGGLPLRYQWRRNGRNLAGANQPTLMLRQVSFANAGSYTCLVSNRLSTGATSSLSQAAELAIVNTAPRKVTANAGSRVSFRMESAGNVALQWFFDNGSEGAQLIFGQEGRSLVLPNAMLNQTGAYYCRATGAGGVLNGGLNELVVFNSVPAFALASGAVLEPTVVSEVYRYEVPMDLAPAKRATRFVAAGLPPGLRIDEEGVISGRATATRYPLPYRVSITASNARGATTINQLELLVKPLPGGIIGAFTGWVARQNELNSGLGGRLDLKTTPKGAVTGKMVLGARVHAFRGVLDTDETNQDVAVFTAQIRRGKQAPLVISFTLDATTQELAAGSVTEGVSVASVEGWRNKWPRAVKGSPPPAGAVGGYYTVGLQIPGPGFLVNPALPQGTGYATFTVNPKTARLKMAGRLADGVAITGSTFVGPAGQVLVFRTLYAANARGSLLGALRIQEMAANKDNTVGGTVSWWSPATPAASTRLYQQGFGPLAVDAVGGRYDPPGPSQIVLGIDPLIGPFNAQLSFAEANVEMAVPLLNTVEVLIGANHRVTMALDNPRETTLRIVPRTGLLNGGFVLRDDHPDLINGGRPQQIKRVVRYSGAIIKNGGDEEGLGYFLLPQLPSSAAESILRTEILSGQMRLEKLP
jgi:hypothetical protein